MKKIVSIVLFIAILFIGCGHLPKPTVSNKVNIENSNHKLVYLLITDEYAVNKKVASVLGNHLKYYYRYRLHSDIMSIKERTEITDKNSILIDVDVYRTVDGYNDTLFVTYKAFDNKTNNLLFEYNKLGKTKVGWNKATKYLADSMSRIAMKELSIER